jgi:hypothetical protein
MRRPATRNYLSVTTSQRREARVHGVGIVDAAASGGQRGRASFGAWLDRANTISATNARSEGRNAFYVHAGSLSDGVRNVARFASGEPPLSQKAEELK